MHKIIIGLTALTLITTLVACKNKKNETVKNSYSQISMAEAMEAFKLKGDYVILDVREMDEYASGHIPGAMNIPLSTIEQEAEEVLTDKDQVVYVYCRSGNRSKSAAQILFDKGYTNIIECGGISSYTGELEY